MSLKSMASKVCVLLALLFTPSLALAADLTPTGSPAAVLVRAEELGGNYFELKPGEKLDFAVQGPAKVKIYARQKLPVDTDGAGAATLRPLGDGHTFMSDITIPGDIDPNGRVLDLHGGTPTLAANQDAELSLSGAHVLSLSLTQGQYPVLVRVELSSGPAPTESSPWLTEDVDLSGPDIVEADPEIWPATPTLKPDATTKVEPPPPAKPAAEPTTAAPPPPREVSRSTASLDEEPARLEAGLRLGLGSAPSASRTLGYIGLEARFPMTDHLGLGVAVGRYGIHYEGQLAVQLPLGGAGASTVETVDWTTKVRPLEATVRYGGVPLGGSVSGFGAVGLAGYASTRVDHSADTKVSGVSVGLTGAVGADIPLGPGLISPSLSLNTGRRGFDNPAEDGDEARERIRSTRINASYLLRF